MLKYKKYNYEVFNFFIKINSKYKSQCNFIKKLKLNDLIENLKFSINNNFKFLSEYIFDILIKKRKNNKFRSSLLFVLNKKNLKFGIFSIIFNFIYCICGINY